MNTTGGQNGDRGVLGEAACQLPGCGGSSPARVTVLVVYACEPCLNNLAHKDGGVSVRSVAPGSLPGAIAGELAQAGVPVRPWRGAELAARRCAGARAAASLVARCIIYIIRRVKAFLVGTK